MKISKTLIPAIILFLVFSVVLSGCTVTQRGEIEVDKTIWGKIWNWMSYDFGKGLQEGDTRAKGFAKLLITFILFALFWGSARKIDALKGNAGIAITLGLSLLVGFFIGDKLLAALGAYLTNFVVVLMFLAPVAIIYYGCFNWVWLKGDEPHKEVARGVLYLFSAALILTPHSTLLSAMSAASGSGYWLLTMRLFIWTLATIFVLSSIAGFWNLFAGLGTLMIKKEKLGAEREQVRGEIESAREAIKKAKMEELESEREELESERAKHIEALRKEVLDEGIVVKEVMMSLEKIRKNIINLKSAITKEEKTSGELTKLQKSKDALIILINDAHSEITSRQRRAIISLTRVEKRFKEFLPKLEHIEVTKSFMEKLGFKGEKSRLDVFVNKILKTHKSLVDLLYKMIQDAKGIDVSKSELKDNLINEIDQAIDHEGEIIRNTNSLFAEIEAL